jgi:Domain of unknown function (DUF4249)
MFSKNIKSISQLVLTTISTMIVFTSCQTEADIPLPEVDPKIVINCFIGDELEVVKAFIFKSNPVFSDTNGNYPNTSEVQDDMYVVISNGVLSSELVFNEQTEAYEVDTDLFPLVAGGNYTLTVTAPDGETVKANTTIPANAPIIHSSSYQVEQIDNDFYGEQTKVTIKQTLTDPSISFDYYRFYYVLEDQFMTNTYVSEDYADDNLLDGNLLYNEHEMTAYYGSDNPITNVKAFVILGSEEYYRFHKTVYYQSPGDPFSEPSIIYSNVDGGLGVFAGYRQVEVIIE